MSNQTTVVSVHQLVSLFNGHFKVQTNGIQFLFIQKQIQVQAQTYILIILVTNINKLNNSFKIIANIQGRMHRKIKRHLTILLITLFKINHS